ncbi:MAG: hypothetical protein H6729_05075 [Deltaproteobacteria bacterium]|nr:hypothetical protein [Deltaproteobacteria bacterium]
MTSTPSLSTTRRRRVFSEHLPPELLGERATIDLLQRFNLEVIVALPPDRETPPMAEALERLCQAGVPIGVWPLLEDAEGYWPSEQNVEAFVSRVSRALDFVTLGGASSMLRTVAIDLEPPLEVTRLLLEGSLSDRLRTLARGAKAARTAERRNARTEAVERFAALQHGLEARGLETIATAIPPVLFDLEAGADYWQSLFRTPSWSASWSKVSPMMYTSILRSFLPFQAPKAQKGEDEQTRGGLGSTLVYLAARALSAHAPARASISLGCVGVGKLGDEPVMTHPAQLKRDVCAARSGGVDDLALFALEGVLASSSPEAWLSAFALDEPHDGISAPRFEPSRAVSSLVSGATLVTRFLCGWTGARVTLSPRSQR